MSLNSSKLLEVFNATVSEACKQGLQGSNFILVAYVCSIIGILGIPANILTICVLRSDTKRNTARYLMLILATQDLILILLYITYYILPLLYPKFGILSWFIQVIWSADSPILFLLGWFKLAEAYTIVSISLDRFVALRYPFKSASICTVSNAKRAQLVIVLFGLVEKLPLLVLDFCYYDWSNKCDSCEPYFRNQSWYNTFWLVYVQLFDQIVTFLIPLLCLVIVNVYLIWQLQSVKILRFVGEKVQNNIPSGPETSSDGPVNPRYTTHCHQTKPPPPRLGRLDHYRQQNDTSCTEAQNLQDRQRRRTHQVRNVSAMLVCVITVFIICETPTALYFFRDLHSMVGGGGERDKESMHSLYAIALLTAMLNFASNFLIYGLVGRRFRWLLKATFSGWIYRCAHCRRKPPLIHRGPEKFTMLQAVRLRNNHHHHINNNTSSCLYQTEKPTVKPTAVNNDLDNGKLSPHYNR